MNLLSRVMLCSISILALTVLGLLGDELQNLARTPLRGSCGGPAIQDLPYPTQLALEIYGINTGNFRWSLTPFMIVLGGLAACARGDRQLNQFWTGFAATWLLVLSYFGLYVWALLLPWHTACASIDKLPIEWIVLVVNAVLVIAAVIVYRRVCANP